MPNSILKTVLTRPSKRTIYQLAGLQQYLIKCSMSEFTYYNKVNQVLNNYDL